MTSTTLSSSSHSAICGPNAVRNMRAPREIASALWDVRHHIRPRFFSKSRIGGSKPGSIKKGGKGVDATSLSRS